MSNYNNDSVCAHTFTPREYQVELLDRLKSNNTIVCATTSGVKAFIAVKLVQELSPHMRPQHGKRALYILDPKNIKVLARQLQLLTDLPVIVVDKPVTQDNWHEWRLSCSIFITTPEISSELLQYIKDISLLNLVIIDDGFYGDRIKYLKQLMDCYHTAQEPPKLISLVSGLLTEDFNPCHLEPEIKRLEVLLKSTVDTSSELTTQIRMGSKPKEFLIVYRHQLNGKLYLNMLRYISDVQEFFDDHRYDPSEIYTEEFLDDIRNIPDPKGVPIMLLYQFRYILEEYGCWCAYQAAMQILLLIEKLKVKVAYERHYLLLCMLSTAMMFVRATYEAFCTVESELYNIFMLSTPKVYRFLDVLKQLGPPITAPATNKGVDTIPHPPPMPPVLEPQTHVKPKKQYKGQRRNYQPRPQPDDSICALILVENRLIAKVFHLLLTTLAANDINYSWIGVLYTSDKIADPVTEAKEAEVEHRRQEEVLRRFRAHDCNILIATSILEQGFDLPKCNLVIQMDVPKSFHSYVHCKARARAALSYYISFIPEIRLDSSLMKYAEYLEIEDILLKRCGVTEPNDAHVSYADEYCQSYMPYVTKQNEMVTLNTSIQLINRYCAKLPSDTFTKLVPNFEFKYFNGNMVTCILRLPINSPIKTSVVSPPFTNQVLAKRFAAFYMCQLLHKSNELDDYLNPITKENFRAIEDDWNDFSLEKEDEELSQENVEQRPGTTKRRQYFFKRVASALSDCLPNTETPTYFYRIVMTLTCPIPEEQNTRGRKIYPPEESSQGFGILTSREIPQICPFPIFTRSGEVNVSIELCKENVMLTQDQIHIISEFLNYTFTSVLRLQKYQMVFNPANSDSSYFIIPTLTDEDSTEIDWKFLDLIYKSRDLLPESIPDEERASYVFNPADYKDAVVMPWYRNQDQPQYFYVAEICSSLNPGSSFPGMDYDTFEEYYLKKYAIYIQNQKQHLLDVDHTSARLNFLTPRYVNRKGVALPTSSEETKRAKRENLEQKQILVPELCAIHPFPASLWRKAVCLPCILYRVNALLLANQIRHRVAEEINLGKKSLPRDFQWEPLNFGWSLLDVLKKTKAAEEKAELENLEKSCSAESTVAHILDDIFEDSIKLSWEREYLKSSDEGSGIDSEGRDWLEIGTWSNDMVDNKEARDKTPKVRYGSPTSWMHSTYGYNEYDDYSDSDSYYSTDSGSSGSKCGGLHIEFQGDYLAEAVESEEADTNPTQHDLHLGECCTDDQLHTTNTEHDFQRQCERHLEKINATMVVPVNDYFTRVTPNKLSEDKTICVPHNTADYELKPISIRKEAKSVAITEVTEGFSFDKQPDLEQHPGPSPSLILQALTMSNANDGINLERLETIGDSFLKYAITDYLYSKYENTHEGKLSHLRSKQVSNLNLYRLGKRKQLGDLMIATKFDPHDNWLPPCYSVSKQLEEILSKARIQGNYLTLADYVATRHMSLDELCLKLREEGETMDDLVSGMIPYNLVTQHSIPDKSIADCVEALIGAYLIECGPKGALLFMAWLGIRVLPVTGVKTYGELQVPDSPLLQHVENPDEKLRMLLHGYETFEEILGYTFKDRSYLLQALTHASYSPNDVTDCYQRLEFLGDAVLDYLITRHLYEDARMHSPGALTDLRSALVNNTIFASLAVKYKFHRYFRYLSPALHVVIEKFIRIQEEAGHKVSEELFLLDTEEGEEVEDVEVPKVLGDVFESVAGAIFLDSGRSLDAVWRVYHLMMRNEIELFSDKVPKSPIRELLELEPETAKFGTAEKLADGRRVRVAVEVFGKGVFKGVGRNYRIAKCTAAKCALKHLKKQSAYSKLI